MVISERDDYVSEVSKSLASPTVEALGSNPGYV